MARRGRLPGTPAVRALRAAGVEFVPRPYAYQDHGGTRVAARELGVDEHAVIKTLVFEDHTGRPLLVLMHGDRQVSQKALARALGVKWVRPCDPAAAQRHTGYQVGGISPLGTRKRLPVYVQASVLELERIYLNAGRRGLLAELDPRELARLVQAVPVEVAQVE